MSQKALTVAIIGATGHLATTKLIPSLFSLYEKGLLPEKCEIIGFSRRQWTDDEYRSLVKRVVGVALRRKKKFLDFLKHVTYHEGYFEDTKSFAGLRKHIEKTDLRFGALAQKIFYLAISPDSYADVITHIGQAFEKNHRGMNMQLLIEKPFGKDLKSAHTLQKIIGRYFMSDEIFRVDHYLGKDALRFFISATNGAKKPLIQTKTIHSVHVKLFERGDVEGRHDFYDATGAFSDVGQNHVLVMLSTVLGLITDSSKKTIQKKREIFLKSLFIDTAAAEKAFHAQYKGYVDEVGHHTKTETYFRVELRSKILKKAKIILESGKGLARNLAQIELFQKGYANPSILRIQPKPSLTIAPVKTTLFIQETSDAYENVFLAALNDDISYFPSLNEIYLSWKLSDQIKKILKRKPIHTYKKGTLLF